MDVVLGVCHKKTSFKKLALPCGAQKIAFFSLNFGLKLKFVVLIGRANFAVSSVSCARHQQFIESSNKMVIRRGEGDEGLK